MPPAILAALAWLTVHVSFPIDTLYRPRTTTITLFDFTHTLGHLVPICKLRRLSPQLNM